MHFLRSRYGKFFLSLCFILLIIITFLPYGIGYGLQNWLRAHGADDVKIENVDFNLFSGKLELDELRVTVSQDYTLELARAVINVDWLPLFGKELHIKEVLVENTEITIEQHEDGKLLIAGIDAKSSPAAKNAADNNKPWTIDLDTLNIVNGKLHFKQPRLKLTLQIDSASLASLQSRNQEPALFKLAGNVNGSPLRIDSRLTPFATQPAVDADIKLQSLALADFTTLTQPHLQSLAGSLSLDGHIKAAHYPDKGLQIESNGMLIVQDLDIHDNNLQGKSRNIDWSGSLSANIGKQALSLALKGDMNIANTSLRDVHAPSTLTSLLDIEKLELEKIQFENNALHINLVNVQKLQAYLQRDTDGKLAILKLFPAPSNTASTPQTEHLTTAEPGTAVSLRIDDIHIGKNSSLTFEDRSTQPAFKSTLQLSSARINNLDSSKPEQATSFTIAGKVDKFSSLSSEGQLYPFLPKLALNMTSNLTAMELPSLTSYTARMLGYKLTSGQLQADTHVDIHDNKLAGESKLVLSNLSVKALSPEEKKKLDSKADMSLELGLAMLRDKQNNIQLKLPFKGNLTDPEFDLSDAIRQAISKAVTATSLSFLKLSLQPFGSILMVAELAQSVAGAIQLQPITFPPGSMTLDATAVQYQERLAGLLTARPELRIKLCGLATTSDREALVVKARQAGRFSVVISDEQLLQLAKHRADAVKSALISRHKLTAARLFGCQPQIDPDKTAIPRLELIL